MGNTCCTISPILRESMKRRHGEPVVHTDVKKFIANTDLAIDPCAICLEPMKRGDVSRILPGQMVSEKIHVPAL